MNTNVGDAIRADSLQTLVCLGFEEAGVWTALGGALVCHLTRHTDESNILYAFVSNKQILYVGKSTRTFRLRMYGYQKPGPTQTTNIVNHKRIFGMLTRGAAIQIYAFAPQEQMYYRGIPVNLAAGLEDCLIHFLQPPWNSSGKKRMVAKRLASLQLPNPSRIHREADDMSAFWGKVASLEGTTLLTRNQGKEFHVKDVSSDRIVFVPVLGNGTARWCGREELEELSRLCANLEDVTVERMRQEMPESRNTSYLAAILYEVMSIG